LKLLLLVLIVLTVLGASRVLVLSMVPVEVALVPLRLALVVLAVLGVLCVLAMPLVLVSVRQATWHRAVAR
jgi:hypothetical protein